MPTTAIKLLKPHPAQMRLVYDLESLATLTLQIYERGLDAWQTIVASPNPGQSGSTKLSEAAGEEAYHIISGHRRHKAQLLAFTLRDWARERPETEITIEVVRTMVNTLVESLGSLEAVIASLLTKYGHEEVEFVTFEGSQKAEILALQAANYGSEKPDALGVAHSFRQAVEAGATPEEIARNSGQHLHYVLNHLALMEIPPELAQRIAAGELPMSVATAVADLPGTKRTGLAIFILANEPGKVTAKAIKECAAALKKWPGLQQPLMVKHQAQRNTARALVRLWGQVVEAYPEDAYAAVSMLIHRGLHEDPWTSKEKLTLWFQTLGGDTYFTEGGINWSAVVEHLLIEVGCETCPIAQLPARQLRSELSQGYGGPLGMPCRAGETATSTSSVRAPSAGSGRAMRCIHGLTESDPFDCRVPWDWVGHPGVTNEGGDYRVNSYEELLAAWEAQAAKEQAEDEAAAAKAATSATDGSRPRSAQAEEPETTTAAATTSQRATSPEPQPAEADVPDTSAKDSPIAKQRTQIADFMERNEQLAATHPFATPCGRCRHRLESSPTKDEAVPHCAWAGRLRKVSFKVLEAGENAPQIPVCRQFAPNQPWTEIIPGHPNPPGVPREWLKEQILHLAKAANRYGSSRNSFEFLTGRPMKADESYGDWFAQQLDSHIGELSLEQLFTLFIWAHSEWQRASGHEFGLPLNGKGVQFATYHEKKWRPQQ